MPALHALIANSIVSYYVIVGLWGVFLGFRRAPLSSSYQGALIIAEGLGFVQLIVGVILLVMGFAPRDDMHFLYGLSVIVTLPLVHQYLADRRMRAPMAFGLACLFMAGLAIRAITTGR